MSDPILLARRKWAIMLEALALLRDVAFREIDTLDRAANGQRCCDFCGAGLISLEVDGYVQGQRAVICTLCLDEAIKLRHAQTS